MWTWWIASSWAATVAVLPLEAGVTGDGWNGLGPALSGMMVTDLASVPGIRLVERQRLDEVLKEFDLTASGYVDEQTAQHLGKGLGAEYVVFGTFSVLDHAFRLDARIVDVASGEIKGSASATGTTEHFLDVEQELVRGLVGAYDKALARDHSAVAFGVAPTLDLSALSAWGEGVALQREGDLDSARHRYEAALKADPQFAAARSALGDLRGTLEQLHADHLKATTDAREARWAKVLAATTDERTRPADFKDTSDTIMAFAVRLETLQRAKLDCQRRDEMLHYLDRVGWQVQYPKGGWERLYTRGNDVAVASQFVPAGDDRAWHDAQFELGTGPMPLFQNTAHFLYGFPDPILNVPSSSDLLHTIVRCVSPAETLGAIREIHAQVDAHGAGGQLYDPAEPLMDLDLRLELSEMLLQAESSGIDPAMTARFSAILAKFPAESDGHRRIVSFGDRLEIAGRAYALGRIARLGFNDGEVESLLPTLAEENPAIWRLDDVCGPTVKSWTAWASGQLVYISDQREQNREPSFVGMATIVRSLIDAGCMQGVPARFSAPGEISAWIATAPDRTLDTKSKSCESSWRAWKTRNATSGDTKYTNLNMEISALLTYYSELVLPGCVADPITRLPDEAETTRP